MSTGKGPNEFVSLSWDYGRELVGQYRFDRLMRLLLRSNILERTDFKEDPYGLVHGFPGEKARAWRDGYRFVNPDYRRNYSKVVVTDKSMQKRLTNLRDGKNTRSRNISGGCLRISGWYFLTIPNCCRFVTVPLEDGERHEDR